MTKRKRVNRTALRTFVGAHAKKGVGKIPAPVCVTYLMHTRSSCYPLARFWEPVKGNSRVCECDPAWLGGLIEEGVDRKIKSNGLPPSFAYRFTVPASQVGIAFASESPVETKNNIAVSGKGAGENPAASLPRSTHPIVAREIARCSRRPSPACPRDLCGGESRNTHEQQKQYDITRVKNKSTLFYIYI